MTDAPPAAGIAAKDPMARLTLLAIAIALIVVAVRMSMLESVRQPMDFGTAFSDQPSAPGATTTLLLDLVCWVPALLVLVRRAVDREYVLRNHISHLFMALLAAWVWTSTFWAGDRFAAVINASTWSAAMALGWAASQLVRSWARLRWVLALALGLLLILVAKSAVYYIFERQADIASFEARKAQIFAANHWAADDEFARMFEQRVRSGQLMGFYKSPNTMAAAVAMAAFISLGFAVQRRMDRDPIGFPIALAIPVLISPVLLWLAGSRTAMAGMGVFGAILWVAWLNRERLGEHSRRIFWAGCAAFVAGVAVVVGIGLKTGGLIQDSLNFRWNYWVASWHLWLAHPLLGVGWGSFGDAYLKYRLPVAAEEIKDPHNVLIHFLTETGAIGAALLVAWLGRSLYEMTRPLSPRAAAGESASVISMSAATAAAYALIIVVIAVLSLSSGELIAELPKLLLFGVLLLLGLILGSVRGTQDLSCDPRRAPFLLFATIAGIGGFLLHNLVDFAMFENGPLLFLMLVMGAVLGVRHGTVAGKRQKTWAALAGLAAVFFGLIVEILLLLVPVANAEAKAAEADAAGNAKRYGTAVSLYQEAITASPVPNSDYPLRAVRWMAADQTSDIAAMYAEAQRDNPAAIQPWLALARLGRGNQDNPVKVITNYANVIVRNPNDPSLRIEYGEYLDSIGRRDEAADQFRAALAANATMHADEPRRLPTDRVAAIEERLKR